MGTKGPRGSGIQYNPKGPTQGNTLVDPRTGQPIDVITDSSGIRRLAVDANITVDDITIQTRPLDASTDNVAIKDTVTGAKLKINLDGSIDTNVALDAATGDNVALGNTWKKIIDQPDNITTYIGLAIPGTLTSAASWQIKRITVSGTETFIELAGSSLSFSNVWDNRASLTYG